jgi:di/tricarboxylate transporter
MLVRKQGKPLRKGTANAYLISGLVEEIGLVGLTLVGERENGSGHVVFFCTFLFAAWTHFSTETVLSSNSKKNAASFQIRMVLLSIFHLLVAGVVTTFFAHLLFCTPFCE